MYYTYAHIRLDTNAIFYIGKGIANRLNKPCGRNPHWSRIVNKHGYKAIKLCDWDVELDALKHEICLIQYLRNKGLDLVNMTSGGEGTSGLKHSDETRLKMSKARQGYRHSEETKFKMGKARIGRKRSAAANLKNSIAKKGKHPSDETRLKMSKAQTGRKHSEESKFKIGIANKGHKHSDATKLKLSIAVKLRWASRNDIKTT